MSDYDTDILEWSEQQSGLLKRLAAGEWVNNDAFDWPHIAEEIESVGRSQLSAVKSLLTQALLHMLKAQAWPNSLAAPGWRAEGIRFRLDGADCYTPSMRQHLDIAKLYVRALKAMPEYIDGQSPLPVPDTCPVTLEALLNDL